MATKAPFWTRPHLFVQVHAGTGSPYAVRVNSKKLVGLVLFLATAYCVFLTGSLLFFRELEVSRKLSEKVLEFETAQKLTQQIQLASRNVAASGAAGPDPLPACCTGVEVRSLLSVRRYRRPPVWEGNRRSTTCAGDPCPPSVRR